jgi:hypothetical protein
LIRLVSRQQRRKGAYIEAKRRKEKRKFVKLHILADIKTGKIAGFRITSKHTGDSKKFVPLVKEASKKKKNKERSQKCMETVRTTRRKEELQSLR